MLLQPLQDLLTDIYDLSAQPQVDDFLFTDRARLPPTLDASGTDEQVLVQQQGDAAAIGVFLDQALLQRLTSANPLRTLNGANLADCWSALEGVSHFLYLAWNAGHDRGVSLLELELQAEIDKYVACWWLLREQQPQRYPAELHRLLFERCRVDGRLAGEQAGLYRQANRYAARYCQRLQRRLSQPGSEDRGDALLELRRFYRLSRERKFNHIDRHG